MTYCDPDCPICHGDGYYAKYAESINDPNFGKLFICPNAAKRIWDPGLGIDYDEVRSLNWDNFFKVKPFVAMKQLYDKLLTQRYGWGYIYGPPGVGKTLTAKAAVIRANYGCQIKALYVSHSRVLNHLRSSYDDDKGQRLYELRLKEYSDIPMLVIDEIGRDRGTAFGVSVLSDLLNARYEGALKRKTITVMISNFAPNAVLDDYQQDRVKDKRFDCLHVEGDSLRQHLTYQQSLSTEDDGDWWQTL